MNPLNRRELLKRAGLAGAGVVLASGESWGRELSPNEKLNVGIIGVAGRGGANTEAVARTENVVALCDMDAQRLDEAAAKFPQAGKYADFRKLLERRDLDAVVVSTPDHTHAAAAMAAMETGRHVYCEKPLTHSIYEARRLAETAARTGVATQMGNQGHSNAGTRRVVELVRSGAVGAIREVHCWTDRPIWPQGIDRATETVPVPAHVDWDLWLGPAPERPYNPAYHPFKWRGWWEFGTGALGDMACHVMDTAFWALQLDAPESVEAEGEPYNTETAPNWMIVRYHFGARGKLPPLRLTWYDGKKLPPAELALGEAIPENGTILVGEKGTVLLPDPYGSSFVLLPKERFAGFTPPRPTIPDSPGHHAEWIAACKAGKGSGTQAGSHFAYAAALTEMVLLGNVAYRCREKLYWDRKKMQARGCADAERYIRGNDRTGWTI
jgi:predicted dehydrogenase